MMFHRRLGKSPLLQRVLQFYQGVDLSGLAVQIFMLELIAATFYSHFGDT